MAKPACIAGVRVTLPNPEPQARHVAASRELVTALEEWDAVRADRALCALLARRSPATLFELLRPYSARCFAGVGHKLLLAVQLERVLERLDPRVAATALRALVLCLIHPDVATSARTLCGSLRVVDRLRSARLGRTA